MSPVLIEGVPVQFLPPYSGLLEDALVNALDMRFGETTTRVLPVENLIAICLETSREKDRMRAKILLDRANIDHEYLNKILKQFNLQTRWREWAR